MRKTKLYNVFAKIRAALRDIYRYSPMRRDAIKAVTIKDPENGKGFHCQKCGRDWPIQMAEVDHEPPLGHLEGFTNCTLRSANLGEWAKNLFYGPVQVICKLCHKKKTISQRRKSVHQ